MQQWLTLTLPASRTRAAWTLALFAAIQLADATMTFAGVQQFGVVAEGNPILAFYMATFGVGLTLICAKGVVLLLAAALHVCARHLLLVLLTLVYVVGAIWPWAWTLVA